MKIYREIIDDFSVGWTGAAMKDLSVLQEVREGKVQYQGMAITLIYMT